LQVAAGSGMQENQWTHMEDSNTAGSRQQQHNHDIKHVLPCLLSTHKFSAGR
jgi:hypothetical protein